MCGSADRADVRILGGGQNWVHVTSQLAHGLSAHLAAKDPDSTVSMVTGLPKRLCLEGPRWVAEGRYDMGITTPTWYAQMAIEGRGPFRQPLPLSLIAVLPHDDQLALAVRASSPLQSVRDIRARRHPLRVSMPPIDTPAGWVIQEIFRQCSFSVEDIQRWGGAVLNDRPSDLSSEAGAPVDPTFEAVLDEAVMTRRWHRIATEYELRFLALDEAILSHCESLGMARGVLRKQRLQGVDEDTPTVDFSGWALYCRANLPEEVGYLTARALHDQSQELNRRFAGELAGMTSPLDIREADRTTLPIHKGAARYYAEIKRA